MPKSPDLDAAKRDRAAALTLIEDSAVMTLAVTTAEGPWAAPVYYAYLAADVGFYFFSSPESRHIKAALDLGACAAAIFRPAHALETHSLETHAWETICGLQMRGELSTAGVIRGTRALAHYLKKFPFSRSLLPQGKDTIEVFQHHLGVRFYRFSATRIEWTDNRVRFGYRNEVTLG
jgi:uncharacterized protein YhbP (UPF0306 family)